MGCFRSTGGYDNPAIGAWAVGLAIQSVIALLVLLLAETGGLPSGWGIAADPGDSFIAKFISTELFYIFGVVHAGLVAVCLLVVICGYFFLPVALVVTCPLLIISQLACIAISVFGGYILARVYDFRTAYLESIRSGGNVPVGGIIDIFGGIHQATILVITTMALCALIPLSRVSAIDKKGTMADIMLYMPVNIGFCVIGGILVFPTRDTAYLWLGSVWLIIGMATTILISMEKCGGVAVSKIGTALLCVCMIAGALMAVATAFIVGFDYLNGRDQVVRVMRMDATEFTEEVKTRMSADDFQAYLNFIIMGHGAFNSALVASCAMTVVYCLISGCFTFRALLGDSKAVNRASNDGSESSDREA